MNIYLRRGREQRVLGGHPWVFRSDIEREDGAADGDSAGDAENGDAADDAKDAESGDADEGVKDAGEAAEPEESAEPGDEAA